MKLYQTRWSVFRRWCRRRDTSAYAMSIPLLLRFFRYLFEKRNLKYITVVGYRASLRDFMVALELPIVRHPLLTCLFSHYHRNVPKRKNPCAPKWCLSVVLNFLKTDVYEPLEKADLRALTAKTAFLTCFALAARTSELQGLVGQVCFGKHKTAARLTYDDRFWLKMENTLREVKRELRIPALSQITDEPEELVLCPVRALRIYCNKMRALDANRSRLFVSPSNLTKVMSKNAITHILKQLIITAHKPSNLPDDFRLAVITNFKPREIRALSASLSFISTNSMEAIRDASIWRGNSVFASHYLRKRALECYDEASDTYALRPLFVPIVAAQGLVPASKSCSTGTSVSKNCQKKASSRHSVKEKKAKRPRQDSQRRKSL